VTEEVGRCQTRTPSRLDTNRAFWTSKMGRDKQHPGLLSLS